MLTFNMAAPQLCLLCLLCLSWFECTVDNYVKIYCIGAKIKCYTFPLQVTDVKRSADDITVDLG